MKLRAILQSRVSLPKVNIRTALLAIIIYIVAVVGVAILIADDPNWNRWHISYLGENPGFVADFFNYGLMIGGALMVWFSFQLNRYLMKENSNRKDDKSIHSTGVSIAVMIIAISVYCVGMFPLSYGKMPHDIFGYSIYFTCLFLTVASPWLLPGMRKMFYIIPYLFHALTLTIFILFWMGASESMYLAEVTTFISLAWWLDMVTSGRMYIDKK